MAELLKLDVDGPVSELGRPPATAPAGASAAGASATGASATGASAASAGASATASEESVPFPYPSLRARPPWPPFPWWVRVWLLVYSWVVHQTLDVFYRALAYGGDR